MRSDLISAGLTYRWLSANAPHFVEGWDFEIPDDVAPFIEKLLAVLPNAETEAASQGAVAKAAIDFWGLTGVAILGGGTPTPLSPTPDQVLYFTDGNPEVVSEVAELGYTTRCVDVMKARDFSQLKGASTAIATGLFHFLPDDAIRLIFSNLTQTGFHKFAFNCGTPAVSEGAKQAYAQLGYQGFFRTRDDIEALLSSEWHLTSVYWLNDFFKQGHELAEQFVKTESIFNIYLAERD